MESVAKDAYMPMEGDGKEEMEVEVDEEDTATVKEEKYLEPMLSYFSAGSLCAVAGEETGMVSKGTKRKGLSFLFKIFLFHVGGRCRR